MKKIKIAIFDFDGTVIHSMESISTLVNDLSNSYDMESFFTIIKDPSIKIYNLGLEKIIELLSNDATNNERIMEEFVDKAYPMYENFPLLKGIEGFLKKLRKQEITIILLTCNHECLVKKVVEDRHLDYLFDEIIGSTSLINGKKTVDTYRHIVQKYDVKPEECIVFEDSIEPAEEAIAAGMRCVMINGNQFETQKIDSFKYESIIQNYDIDITPIIER